MFGSYFRRMRLKNRLIFLILFVILFHYSMKLRFEMSTKCNSELEKSEEIIIKSETMACKIPQLKLDDPEINHFFKPYPPLKCTREKNWAYVENQKFFIDESSIKAHGSISCDYVNIWRITDDTYGTNVTENYPSGSPIMGDYFMVNCSALDGSTYKNIHATVKASPEVIERSRNAKPNVNGLNLNVQFLLFDSISRMTFMRKLPKTYAYITSALNAIVLEGYNIVGDGTPQALLPMLTGQMELELPLTRKRFSNASYVNVYPWIWNEFRDQGYATLFSEDCSKYSSFTYRLKGFLDPPTDHYMRTFYEAADNLEQQFWCFGNIPSHLVQFAYSEDFFKNYPQNVRKFSFVFNSKYSHDDINAVEIADEDTIEHIKFFEKNGHLNDTILILLADHGHRFDKLRATQQGKLEERLPFVSFIFPPWFEKRYPLAINNFRLNAHRLTTPFDIHPTLRDILNFEYPPKKGSLNCRNISLFVEIPSERTCVDSDIEAHWCTCLEWRAIPITDERVKKIAESLVEKINAETEYQRSLCMKLNLKKIVEALTYKSNENLVKFRKSSDLDGFEADLSGNSTFFVEYFQITIRTTPGKALYEASVKYNSRYNNSSFNVNEISRINKYGDIPHCIREQDFFLAKYCVCYDKV